MAIEKLFARHQHMPLPNPNRVRLFTDAPQDCAVVGLGVRFGGKQVFGSEFLSRQQLAVPVYWRKDVARQLNSLLGGDAINAVYPPLDTGQPQESRFQRKTVFGPITLKAAYRPKHHDIMVAPEIPSFLGRPYLRVLLDETHQPRHLLVMKDPYNIFGTLFRRTPLGYLLGDATAMTWKNNTERVLYRIYLYQHALVRMGSVPHQFVDTVLQALLKHTPEEMKRFIRRRSRVHCAERVIDVFPHLASRKIPLSPDGATFDTAAGVYDPLTRKVVVARTSLRPLSRLYLENYDIANITSHELGHAHDDDDNYFSQSRRFALAYSRDLKRMTQKTKQQVADWLGVRVNKLKAAYAKGEVYARIYAQLRQGKEFGLDFDPLKALSSVTALLRHSLQ